MLLFSLSVDCYRACLTCFVMLSQFILSLSKGSIAVRVVLLFYHSFSVCFSTFCLDAKGGAKKSRQARTAPRVLPPTHNNSHYSIHHSFTSFQAA
jgi:hypothetical protein